LIDMTFLPQDRIPSHHTSVESVSALDQRTTRRTVRQEHGLGASPNGVLGYPVLPRFGPQNTNPPFRIVFCFENADAIRITSFHFCRRPNPFRKSRGPSRIALFLLDQAGYNRTRPLQLFFRPRSLQMGAADEETQRDDQDKDQIKNLRDMGGKKHADEDK
jgi:hypothetical protein